jgi:general secretion pathway protein M
LSPQLSPALQRLLAVALLLAAISLFWSFLIAPALDDYAAAQATIERLTAALERSRAGERDIAGLEAELSRLRERQKSIGGALQDENESIAAARLQNRLKSVIDAVKGELRSTQVLPVRDEGNFRRITVRGQISLDLPALQRVIYELEAALPYVFLDNVEIRSRFALRRREPVKDDPVLDVRLDLSGYMRRAT